MSEGTTVEGEANVLGATADEEAGRFAVPPAEGDAGMLD